jgi:hypothetical protein
MLAPINYRCAAAGGSSPAHCRSTALGADAFQAHPIPAGNSNRFGSIAIAARPLRDSASSHQRATTAALGLRVGGGGLFHSGDDAGGDCVKPFHTRNPAPVGGRSRVFA